MSLNKQDLGSGVLMPRSLYRQPWARVIRGSYRLRRIDFALLRLTLLVALAGSLAFAQGSTFTYQGRLTDGGNPANSTFDFQFRLFDLVSGGAQQGPTVTLSPVPVAAGIFTVQLDFGACATCFNGAARFLEIGVRPAGSPNPYTILAPREPVTATPYAIRSTAAGTADNATQLGGIVATGFIQNTTSPQSATNFNISGNGTLGGTLSADSVGATTQFNINGNRVLSVAGSRNLFVGVGAGQANTTGSDNSFVGNSAGNLNTTGGGNAFFGTVAGGENTTGGGNSFFGTGAGALNTAGINNSFFGNNTGVSNTTGDANSFFGTFAGNKNTTGVFNSFFGVDAGASNTTGASNCFFGVNAGQANTTGVDNSFFGTSAGYNNTTGASNSFFGLNAGLSNTTGGNDSFVGFRAGYDNTTGGDNTFTGFGAGFHNTTGNSNSFIGSNAGISNTTGAGNTSVGRDAGLSNTTENNNTFIGFQANGAAGITNASAIGANAVVAQSNSMVLGNNTNVGIGTSMPAASLHILGPALDPPITLPALQNGLLLGLQSTSGYKWIQAYGGHLALNPRGNNVGIGTSAPAFTLDVAGVAHASSFPTSSDARLKTNLAQLIDVLDKIEKIRGVAFDWNQVYVSLGRSTGHREIGVVAQEVEAVFPELVTRWGEQGYRAVDYGRLTAVLVEAVKELRREKDRQVEALRAENAALRKRQAGLDARLKAVEDDVKALAAHRFPPGRKRKTSR